MAVTVGRAAAGSATVRADETTTCMTATTAQDAGNTPEKPRIRRLTPPSPDKREDRPKASSANRPDRKTARTRKRGRRSGTQADKPASIRRREELHIWDDPRRQLVIAAVTDEGAKTLLEVLTHDLLKESLDRPPIPAGTIAACRVDSRPGLGEGLFVDIGRGPHGYMRGIHIPPYVVRDKQRVPVEDISQLREGDMFLGQVAGEERGSKGPRVTGRVRTDTMHGTVSAGNPLKSHHTRVRMLSANGSHRETALPAGTNHDNRLTTDLGKRMTAVLTAGTDDIDSIKADLRAGAKRISDLRNKVDTLSGPTVLERPVAAAASYYARNWNRSIGLTVMHGKRCARWLSEELAGIAGVNGPDGAEQAMALTDSKVLTGDNAKAATRRMERLVERALKTKVPLDGGGSLVIEETEAFAAVIDVNSGKQPHGAGGASSVNLAAAEAIPAEIRARGLGGQIVIDFIDLDGSEASAKKLVDRLTASSDSVGLEAQIHRKAAIAMMGPLEQGIVLMNSKRTTSPLSQRYWKTRDDSRRTDR